MIINDNNGLNCSIKANYPQVGPGPADGVPSVRVFLNGNKDKVIIDEKIQLRSSCCFLSNNFLKNFWTLDHRV